MCLYLYLYLNEHYIFIKGLVHFQSTLLAWSVKRVGKLLLTTQKHSCHILTVDTSSAVERENGLDGVTKDQVWAAWLPPSQHTHTHTDSSLIHRLSSFIVLWSCTETEVLTINCLESIETNYMDTNPGMFSSKTFISFWLKKEIHKHLGWHGGE